MRRGRIAPYASGRYIFASEEMETLVGVVGFAAIPALGLVP